MQAVNDCFQKVKKDCFKFISSQETKTDKFKNKDKMIKLAFTIEVINLNVATYQLVQRCPARF